MKQQSIEKSTGEANTHIDCQSSGENSLKREHSVIPISTDEALNCTIEANSYNAHNGNGHAIIDVVNTTHTGNDQSKVTVKPSEQLPYTQTANHKSTQNTIDVDVSACGAEESNQQKLSNKIVVLVRRSKPIALVVINSVLAVLIATLLCISMGFDYTIPAIVVGLIAVVASSGLWHWLYIAAVTAPRDVRYVFGKRLRKIWMMLLAKKASTCFSLSSIECSVQPVRGHFYCKSFNYELCRTIKIHLSLVNVTYFSMQLFIVY